MLRQCCLLAVAVSLVNAEAGLRKMPASSCKGFAKDSLWLRNTRLFEPPKLDYKPGEDPEETIEHRQHFTLACRPVLDVENRLGIPWHVVLTRTNQTDNKELRGVLARSLARLGFRHIGVNGDVLPRKFESRNGGLRSAFEERLPDTFYITVLPHPEKHCLSHINNGQKRDADQEAEALRLCHNSLHRAVRWNKGQSPQQVVDGYNLVIPVDRLDEALLVMQQKLGLEMQDVLYIREGSLTTAMTKGEKQALLETGVAHEDLDPQCPAWGKSGGCNWKSTRKHMIKRCPRTCYEVELEEDKKAQEEEKALQDKYKEVDDTTEAPDDDEELVDEDEVHRRFLQNIAEQRKDQERDAQVVGRAMQEFVMSNELDYHLVSLAHEKLNQQIDAYGPSFFIHLKQFRTLMHSVNTECKKLSLEEQGACMRQVGDGRTYGDL